MSLLFLNLRAMGGGGRLVNTITRPLYPWNKHPGFPYTGVWVTPGPICILIVRNRLVLLCYDKIIVVLYGCETWSLTLKEGRRLRVFENRVLSRIFGPRSDEVTGEWRKLHNDELNDLYPSPNFVRVIKSRRMRWARHIARMGGEERRIQGFGGEI